MTYPIVAIVGRPNVGKSTLFNRLVGQRMAITAEEPGTTRDRIMANIEWEGRRFSIVDTAGLDPDPADSLVKAMMAQVRIAIEDADAIIFVTDVNDGVTPTDLDVADMLRRSGTPVVLAANKSDSSRRELGAPEFYRLGLGDPIPISAYHNSGIGDLLDQVTKLLPPAPPEPEAEGMRLAIVGRPNSGKSMLLNALLGEERAVVSEVPGTTRDSIDTVMEYHGERVTLIDTAGIKRRGRTAVGIEKFSAMRSMRAIDRADTALLLLDASDLLAAQDAHIGGYVLEAYKGLIIAVNKWDLAGELGLTEETCEREIRIRFRFAPFSPILYTSGLKRIGLEGIMETASAVHEERMKRVPTSELNRVIERAVGENLPRLVGKRRLHLLYVTQASVNPPTFILFVNDPRLMHFSYQRFLENRLREEFGFVGTPIKLISRARGQGE